VSSYGFSNWYPVGHLKNTLRRLDEMFVDEIIVLNVGSSSNDSSLLELARAISDLPIHTPIAVGGGITDLNQALEISSYGVERVVIGRQWIEAPHFVMELAEALGTQSIVLSCPFRVQEGSLFVSGRLSLEEALLSNFYNLGNLGSNIEFLMMDMDNEGNPDDFNLTSIEIARAINPAWDMIIYGGVGEKTLRQLASTGNLAAIAFGNGMHAFELWPQILKVKWPQLFRPRTSYVV
jgi:cyclase